MSSTEPYRVLVTGSRDWSDQGVIHDVMDAIRQAHRGRDLVLVSGNCPTGADAHAEGWGEIQDWAVELHPADWATHGKAAGPRRNAEMVALGADVCIAFIRNNSRGASMTAALADQAGIPTYRYLSTYPEDVNW
jgi:hypothetical protein